MYICQQLLNPNERRLRLSSQLGVGNVVPDNRGTELVSAAGGVSEWDAVKLAAYRRWVEGFDLQLDVFALVDPEHLPEVQRADGGLMAVALAAATQKNLFSWWARCRSTRAATLRSGPFARRAGPGNSRTPHR